MGEGALKRECRSVLVVGLIANAIWAWWSVRSKKSRESLRATESLWKARLNHEGYAIRSEAGSEILVRALYWLVLGNLSFAVSGLSWALLLTDMGRLQPLIAEVTFLTSVAFLAISLRWLRRYLRLKGPLDDPRGSSTSESGSNSIGGDSPDNPISAEDNEPGGA